MRPGDGAIWEGPDVFTWNHWPKGRPSFGYFAPTISRISISFSSRLVPSTTSLVVRRLIPRRIWVLTAVTQVMSSKSYCDF